MPTPPEEQIKCHIYMLVECFVVRTDERCRCWLVIVPDLAVCFAHLLSRSSESLQWLLKGNITNIRHPHLDDQHILPMS